MDRIRKFKRIVSLNAQLILWIFGIYVHNPVTDECTPDFSCCTNIRTPFLKRLKSFKKHWLMVNFHIYKVF